MHAQWISHPGLDDSPNDYFRVRKRFFLPEAPVNPTPIHVTADSRYRLFVNGTLVGTGPVRGSTTLHYYDTWDIGQRLVKGDNTILIEVFSLLEENYAVNSVAKAVAAELPGLLLTDESWESQHADGWIRDVPLYTPQYGRMEYHDYRPKPGDATWTGCALVHLETLEAKTLLPNPLPPFVPATAFPADIRAYKVSAELPSTPSDIPPYLQAEPYSPVPSDQCTGLGTLQSSQGSCVLSKELGGLLLQIDFNKEVSGLLEITLDAPEGTTVQTAYGEQLINGRLSVDFPHQNYHFADCFILKEGTNTVTNSFVRRGFRVVQISIRNFRRDVRILGIRGIDLRYPNVRRGSFFSSDHKLNRIFDVCQETLSACASDVFMDCPWRERSFWVNDLLVNNLANLQCHGATALNRHCLDLVFSQRFDNGMVPVTVPRKRGDGHTPFSFPATNIFLALVLRDYWYFSGDGDTVRAYLPDMENILDCIWKLADSQGILRSSGMAAVWNFFDWSFEQNGYSCNGTRESLLSSLYIIASKALEEMAQALDVPIDAERLRQRRTLTARNFEQRFVSKETGLLQDEVLYDNDKFKTIPTQLGHALWLLTGEASPQYRDGFLKALDRDDCLMPDYYLHYFWFRAARLANLEQVGLQRIRRYWGRCIDTGSPTLYEAGIAGFGSSAMNGAGSLCHGFGTIPVVFCHETILGIRPLQTGFRTFAFTPRLFDLSFAQGSVPTPTGNINVRITPEEWSITVPQDTCAILPDGQRLLPGEHRLPAPICQN